MRASYEERDLNIRSLVGIGAGVVALATLTALLCGLLLMLSSRGNDDFNDNSALGVGVNRTVASASTQPSAGNLTRPAPGTQTNLEETNRRLASFGWTDAAHTRLHIPIDEAMHLLVLQGDSHATNSSKIATSAAVPVAGRPRSGPSPAGGGGR